MQALKSAEQLQGLQLWRPHRMTGDRKGTWSLFVTRNWRLTFWIDTEPAVRDVDLEDYH